jgi:hypothetical protein
MSSERRRHARRPTTGEVALAVRIGHRDLGVGAADVIDVSRGGVFVDVGYEAGVGLGAVVTVDVAGLAIEGRVVRVRLGGRRRGQPVRPGVAIAFREPHPEAWARLIDALLP